MSECPPACVNYFHVYIFFLVNFNNKANVAKLIIKAVPPCEKKGRTSPDNGMIFIIEPWLWLIMGPFLFSAAQGRIQKVFAGLLLVLAAICVWAVPVLPWLIVLFATLFGLAWFFLARRLKARERLITCWAFLVVLWATFGLTSNAVQKDIELFVRNSTPTSKIDVIVTPFPADPTCWYAIVAHLDGDVYTARSGVVSAWPSIRSVMSCQEKMLDWGEGCAPKVPSDWKDSEQFVWRGKFVGSRSEMERLRRNQCEVETFLQFSRAPYWVKVQDQGKETFLLGDLRFDRAKGMRWSKATVGELKECPRNRPPWIGPRLDWFGGETWNKDIGRSS